MVNGKWLMINVSLGLLTSDYRLNRAAMTRVATDY